MSGILLRQRWHMVLATDSSFDRDKWYIVGALLFLAVVLSIANFVRWRRGKHAADPALKAVTERVATVEEFAAGANSLPNRVAADEERLDGVEQRLDEALSLIMDAFGEAGRPLPPELAKMDRHRPEWLRGVINGGKGA